MQNENVYKDRYDKNLVKLIDHSSIWTWTRRATSSHRLITKIHHTNECSMNDKLVTILGSSYFEPISALLEKLEIHSEGNANEIQSGYYVSGFAASICLLAVVCLESYVMRVRYINKANQEQIDTVSVPAFLKFLYKDFPYENELCEIHILRDAIAHNHLWEISYTSSDEEAMALHAIRKLSSGNKQYRQRVDVTSNVTKTLGLNVNPVNIDANDVKKVLQTMWRVMLFLESKNRNQCYVSHLSAKHKGSMVKFGRIIGLPETCT